MGSAAISAEADWQLSAARYHARVRILIAFLLLASAAPQDNWLRTSQQLDARVADVGFRLAASNVGACSKRTTLSGIVLHSLGQYPANERAAARATFGLGDKPALLAVAQGSPAARAGMRADDALLSVNGQAITEKIERKPSIAAVARARTAIELALAKGPASLAISRGGKPINVILRGIAGCASLIEMIPSNKRNALADGEIVQITSAIALAARDDDELAFVIAHELAHNIKGHYDWLSANKRTKANIKRTEIEADQLSIPLMARAGYDPHAATRFWAHFGGGLSGGILSDGTHMRHGERTVFLRQLAERQTIGGTQ